MQALGINRILAQLVRSTSAPLSSENELLFVERLETGRILARDVSDEIVEGATLR